MRKLKTKIYKKSVSVGNLIRVNLFKTGSQSKCISVAQYVASESEEYDDSECLQYSHCRRCQRLQFLNYI